MPTYQYRCSACDQELERVQAFTDAPLTECPACGGSLRKLFGSVGVVFKGSGFYRNDNRSTGESTKAAADSGSAPAPAKETPATGTSSPGTGSPSTGGSGSGGSGGTPTAAPTPKTPPKAAPKSPAA